MLRRCHSWLAQQYNFSCIYSNFACVSAKVLRFGWYLTLLLKLILSHFRSSNLNQFLPKHKGTVYLVSAIPPTFCLGSLLNFVAVFVEVYMIGCNMDFVL